MFFKKIISKIEFYEFIESIGGKRQLIGTFEQGHHGIKDGEIWLYYRGNDLSLDMEEQSKLNGFF